MQRRKRIWFSLTPGFSQVPDASEMAKPFQRFLRAGCKPLKRFAVAGINLTRLKPGVNDISRFSLRLCVFAPLR